MSPFQAALMMAAKKVAEQNAKKPKLANQSKLDTARKGKCGFTITQPDGVRAICNLDVGHEGGHELVLTPPQKPLNQVPSSFSVTFTFSPPQSI